MQERKYNEIGSEFWLQDLVKDNYLYVLSGRTALDVILQDAIINGHPIQSVYFPAWCCDSMLQPFRERGVEVSFYDLSIEYGSLKYYIDTNYPCDAFYVTNYFGYQNTLDRNVIRSFQERGSIVIYDKTHSLFIDNDEIESLSDYTMASIRKWVGVPCGAYIFKRGQNLKTPHLEDYPYLDCKITAMSEKAAYMNGDKGIEKLRFLDNYGRFANYLARYYRNYRMDDLSLLIWKSSNKQVLKDSRCKNAAFLHAHLKYIPQVNLLFSLNKIVCPLFVPVFLESNKERNELRKYLTENSIYCPIHWPKPSLIDKHMKVNDLFDKELSLVCDQRYGYGDMQYIVNKIKDFYL